MERLRCMASGNEDLNVRGPWGDAACQEKRSSDGGGDSKGPRTLSAEWPSWGLLQSNTKNLQGGEGQRGTQRQSVQWSGEKECEYSHVEGQLGTQEAFAINVESTGISSATRLAA